MVVWKQVLSRAFFGAVGKRNRQLQTGQGLIEGLGVGHGVARIHSVQNDSLYFARFHALGQFQSSGIVAGKHI